MIHTAARTLTSTCLNYYESTKNRQFLQKMKLELNLKDWTSSQEYEKHSGRKIKIGLSFIHPTHLCTYNPSTIISVLHFFISFIFTETQEDKFWYFSDKKLRLKGIRNLPRNLGIQSCAGLTIKIHNAFKERWVPKQRTRGDPPPGTWMRRRGRWPKSSSSSSLKSKVTSDSGRKATLTTKSKSDYSLMRTSEKQRCPGESRYLLRW